MEQGKAPDCFAVDFFKATENSDMSMTQKIFVMGNLLEGGSDTSRVAISQIIAAAVTYPDWVIRAREHLDRVCGSNAERLPTWADKPELRYITAVTKEGFRWRPFQSIGAPHKLTEDDEYEGYKFPAGTLFTWNAYHISQSPDEYEQPDRFWPERWLNDDLDNVLKGLWAFGPGRWPPARASALVSRKVMVNSR
jgi:cytochrome P450